MNIVAPSILSCDFLQLKDEILAFEKEQDLWFHLDIMDGHYVPNLTFGKTVIQNLHKITKHKLDAHLMVTNPQDYVAPLSDLGIHNLSFHWEVAKHHHSLIADIKKSYPSVGISLNPGTSPKSIDSFMFEMIDVVLVMSVNPGFGGQSFIDGAVGKIEYLKELREKHKFNFKIEVDGGVNAQNAATLRGAGADILVAGSFIFKSDDYSLAIEKLR